MERVCSAVDVGSNTVRMLIQRITSEGAEELLRTQRITRLAGGMMRTGLLRREGMEETLRVLKEYASLMRLHRAEGRIIFGTSALREARNSRELINRVYEETGLTVRVLSEEEEGVFTFRGVTRSMDVPTCLIIDVGGGSTEFILSVEGEVRCLRSIPIGVVKLAEEFIPSDPPSPLELEALQKELESILRPLLRDLLRDCPEEGPLLVGTGGTATTLAAIDLGLEAYRRERVHRHTLSLERLREIFNRLSRFPLAEREGIRGLERKRADVIVPGAALTIAVMEASAADTLTVSDAGILEGALISLAES